MGTRTRGEPSSHTNQTTHRVSPLHGVLFSRYECAGSADLYDPGGWRAEHIHPLRRRVRCHPLFNGLRLDEHNSDRSRVRVGDQAHCTSERNNGGHDWVGSQAEAQLAAVCAVRDISHAKVFSRTTANREAFAFEMSEKLGTNVVAAESAEECVAGVDIVITITNSREPVLKGEWLAAGQHINAAGSNHWMRRELDDAAVERSDIIVVDDLEQAKMECGELVFAAERGRFRWDTVHELRDVVAGRTPGRTDASSITLFESQGLSIEDLACAHYVYHKAREQGVGQELPF